MPLLVHMTGFGGIGSMLLLLHSAGRWLKPKWHVQLLAARSLGPATSFPFQNVFAASSRMVVGFSFTRWGVSEGRRSPSDACIAMGSQGMQPKALLQLQEGSRRHGCE